jgi:hypothetical protein
MERSGKYEQASHSPGVGIALFFHFGYNRMDFNDIRVKKPDQPERRQKRLKN